MKRKQKKNLIRILCSAVLVAAFWLLPTEGWFRTILFLAPYLIVGYDILIKAGKGIWHLEPFDENFLMALATVGAFALGETTEAVAVMLFYQIGELFQSIAVGKSRKNIAALMDIRPDTANLETGDGAILTVPPDEVTPGSIIVVRPGEKIPIDGTVIAGNSSVDTSALTGESVPREVGEGDSVISGCVNQSGLLRIRTEKEFGESTVSKILELVENAGSKKAKTENFVSRFARVYTPAVTGAALLLAFLPPLVLSLLGREAAFGTWVYRALSFLVISCPCALVVSIPLGFFAAIGGAGSVGILVKGATYLEALSKVGIVAFDKTGTMTKGAFSVTGIYPENGNGDELLSLAAGAETASLHPIAAAIREKYGKPVAKENVTEVSETAGHGVKAVVGGRNVLLGNEKQMRNAEVALPDKKYDGTVVYVALDGEYAGAITLADTPKPGAARAVAGMKKNGVRRTVMLTGDRAGTAQTVAAEVGADEVFAELLPADKVARVESLMQEKEPGEVLVFVGDGVNDAPVLGRSDVGIAMGALGSDAAIEAADVVLMDDDPCGVVRAIRIARKCMRIVRENILFAISVKFACLLLGALGVTGMWMAIFADVGVMVLAVFNALRLLNVKKIGGAV